MRRGSRAGRPAGSADSTSCAATTACSACWRTTCARPRGSPTLAAARAALAAHLPGEPPPGLRDPAPAFDLLGAALRAAAPAGVDAPAIVVLSDGPSNNAWYEHRQIARRLGLPLVLPERPEPPRRPPPRARRCAGTVDVDVVYRRTRRRRAARRAEAAPTWVAELLLGPVRARHAGRGQPVRRRRGRRQARARLRRGHGPLLPRRGAAAIESVPTYDLGDDDVRAQALAAAGRAGGQAARRARRRRAWSSARTSRARTVSASRELVVAQPDSWVAQEMVTLSTHPTVIDGRLAPRHVDLRPFVIGGGDTATVVPGGLTRVALREGELVVNSSQERRGQGHVGAGMRPLIGVTTSEVRVADQVEATPQGEPPRREMALGLTYLHAIEAAGGLPVVMPPLELDAVDPFLDRLRGHLPVRRARPRPRRLRRAPPPRAGPDRARARRVRAGARASRRRARPSDPGHLPRAAGAQRGARRHAAPAPARPARRHDRASPGRAGRARDALGRDHAGQPAAPGDAPPAGARELVPPPGGEPARNRPARRGLVARRGDRGHRGARATVPVGRAVARRDPHARGASTPRCSRRWSRPRRGTRPAPAGWSGWHERASRLGGLERGQRVHARRGGGGDAAQPARLVAGPADRPRAARRCRTSCRAT